MALMESYVFSSKSYFLIWIIVQLELVGNYVYPLAVDAASQTAKVEVGRGSENQRAAQSGEPRSTLL